MPKSLKQEIIYGIMMVFAMVYAMVCYNVTLNVGGMQNLYSQQRFMSFQSCARLHLFLTFS